MASRWSDIFEREPEHEPELGPSNEPGPQPDSWFADKVEDVPPMQATQAPQLEAEFQDGIEVEEEVILCAGLLPGAQIAERAGGLSPSWPGPRCARPRAHAPGTQRPLPRSFARCRYLDRCRLLLSASAVLGAAKRLGAGLSLRPYFVARRQLLQRGPQRVELAAVEAWRCAPAPLTAPCACAMTPATLCTDPAPPDALTCRLTPSRPTAA